MRSSIDLRICPVCHVVRLEPHPEQPKFLGYLKCSICGYAEKKISENNDLYKNNTAVPDAPPFKVK